MKVSERIFILESLGFRLNNFIDSDAFEAFSQQVKSENLWFTKDNLYISLKNICLNFLQKNTLEVFASSYHLNDATEPKKIGVVASGNIPAVVFHDFLCIFLSGNFAIIKPSSQDAKTILKFVEILIEIDERTKNYFVISERLNHVDAIIATGSTNTSKYFEYYFKNIPHIIRKSRTSVAILTGKENRIELANLGNDIFQYFGLGCRNVSKIFVPNNYDFTLFFESIEYWSSIHLHHKYSNNYDYNKSIYLINGVKHLDNGFLLVKEDSNLYSPLSVLNYESYETLDELSKKIKNLQNDLQCIVENENIFPDSVDFGNSQIPKISDFADNCDTMKFLLQV